MIVKTAQEFQLAMFSQLGFQPYPQDYYTLYTNPERPALGWFIHYSRPDYYEFAIADYTIPQNFSISFHNHDEMMRFGTVYKGSTKFQLENLPVSSFTPSSFFVVEQNIKGQQVWQQGQHYHGAEITIHKSYLHEIVAKLYPHSITMDNFLHNYTYRFLPLDILRIIQKLQSLSSEHQLTPLYLESKMLECIAILTNELNSFEDNSFASQVSAREITIGKDRVSRLTNYDLKAINKAHDILSEQFHNPPTVASLSKQVLLHEQKLKAGFVTQYHMTIGEYTTSLRMTTAANLLVTTELSIEEISCKVGYHYSANFIKMFRKYYNKTPLQFRKGNGPHMH